jgi:hypothetical protein
VGDGAADHRDADHVLLGILARLADRVGDFGGLACARADGPMTIAHDHNRAEVEPAATLDHLGHPVDLHQLLFKLRNGSFYPCHYSSLRNYEL